MKKRPCYVIALFLPFVLIVSTHAQELKRDTTIFKEHQVLFEKMDFIPSEREVKLIRILNNDTAGIAVKSDSYWISSMASNKKYKDYLNAIKLSPVHYQTNELTLESFSELTYLTNLSIDLDSPYIVIYNKASQANTPFKLKDDVDLNIGFRYVQTYRKVPNSY